MRSRQLETALGEFLAASGAFLRAEVAAGAEVPFELASHSGRRGHSATPLYCYRALTGQFIGEREAALKRLPGHAEATKLLEHFEGLDRYLASVGGEASRAKGRVRVRAAVRALLEDAFDEQTDFELRPERLASALERLERSADASSGELELVATLHGLTIGSAELALRSGLKLAHPDALDGVPEAALSGIEGDAREHPLLVVHTTELEDAQAALSAGREALRELLGALRLFGDGRVTLGALAWARVGTGAWAPLALGTGGRPQGMLVVTVEQEDELRAFFNLVSRRAPRGNELAWALRRFELGCERDDPYEALSDNLLALRALLEPEGSQSGLLPGRVAALCATPKQRASLTRRIARALELERSLIAGKAPGKAAQRALVDDIANHLRALLRDVICGHLGSDLARFADELLAGGGETEPERASQQEATEGARPQDPIEHEQQREAELEPEPEDESERDDEPEREDEPEPEDLPVEPVGVDGVS